MGWGWGWGGVGGSLGVMARRGSSPTQAEGHLEVKWEVGGGVVPVPHVSRVRRLLGRSAESSLASMENTNSSGQSQTSTASSCCKLSLFDLTPNDLEMDRSARCDRRNLCGPPQLLGRIDQYGPFGACLSFEALATSLVCRATCGKGKQ